MKAPLLLPVALALVLGGCARTGEIDASGGITAVRSACPVVGVAAGTGDVTLFKTPGATDENAIDLVANMTNVRSTCADAGADIVTTVTFNVEARRTDTAAARDVTLPYYVAIVRGGTNVVAKRVSRVNVHFDAGQARGQVAGEASTTIARSAATLPDDVREKLTRRRKAGDEDAAVDPLTQPEIRQAVASASFEALVGFQLTEAQLKYNATR
ncbi:hypothetical protein SPKIRA_15000 [Sphingomonas paucimobilis]|uniref:Lipoprotein n=2 Tax=Sphingomonas paucimobilis TaxID=13689 RepID=A0A411LIH4_SPHPI|nr:MULTISPECIES: hypothetical protein [Sphingomonas]MBQ1479566.1 hypothetical protein [Sphingomonas sp.]MCM3678136.1 hypothetical protein [Sphingomonas paucimobilis]MDG5972772.1 hypothetical protein [Sphingomonas paucimobilis]NNG59303.1 hypothetical protein [Sphingomonas paucimobilis]QBE92071.1 hypothetical protein DRN02_008590 [Sphingomonas paucimobilis]